MSSFSDEAFDGNIPPRSPLLFEEDNSVDVELSNDSDSNLVSNSPLLFEDDRLEMGCEHSSAGNHQVDEQVDELISLDRPNVPLYSGAKVTKGQSFLLILSYVLRHKLTGIALSDLLDTLNIICPNNTISTSKHLFFKQLKPVKEHLQFHVYCAACQYYIGDQSGNGECEVCKTAWNREDLLKNGHFFIYLPIKSQVQQLLQRDDLSESLKSTLSSKINVSGLYEDINCGKLYKNLCDEGGPLHGSHSLSLTLNCDGVPVFRSSTYSIWPLQGMINELPYEVRIKHVMLFGLWFGTGKPNVNSFLKPYTEECQRLSTEGFLISPEKSDSEHCKVVTAVIMCDSVARPILQNMTQFNGKHGCGCCLHPGEQIHKGNGTVRVYPFYPGVEKRDHISTVESARVALTSKQTVKGVKGPTCLMNIPYFDVISGMPPDHMHNVHLGVVRQMAGLWLDSQNHEKDYYIGGQLSELDQRLMAIKPPCNVTRVPRSFLQRRFWKSSEWHNWLLFYSAFVLKGILAQAYYIHWLTLVSLMFTLSKESITEAELRKSEELAVDFVSQFETLYGKENVSFNVHLCLHLPESVKNWGPLWAHSGYVFESFNGAILKMFHGTQCVPLQIMKQFTYIKALPLLGKELLKDASPECIGLFQNLTGHRRAKQCTNVSSGVTTLGNGLPKRLNAEELLALREQVNIRSDTVVKVFNRVLVRGQAYYSQGYTRVAKRNSYTVMLESERILNVYSYIQVDEDQPRCFALGRLYDRARHALVGTDQASFLDIEHIISLKRELGGRKQAFDVSLFKSKCVLVDLPQLACVYVCIPQKYHVED